MIGKFVVLSVSAKGSSTPGRSLSYYLFAFSISFFNFLFRISSFKRFAPPVATIAAPAEAKGVQFGIPVLEALALASGVVIVASACLMSVISSGDRIMMVGDVFLMFRSPRASIASPFTSRFVRNPVTAGAEIVRVIASPVSIVIEFVPIFVTVPLA